MQSVSIIGEMYVDTCIMQWTQLKRGMEKKKMGRLSRSHIGLRACNGFSKRNMCRSRLLHIGRAEHVRWGFDLQDKSGRITSPSGS